MWTVISTQEYPPADLEAFQQQKQQKRGIRVHARELLDEIKAMPPTMRQLGSVQFLTWLGLFCMWLYFSVTVAHNVFGASDPSSPAYKDGVEWAGVCFGVYSAVCAIFSLWLPKIARKISRKHTHSLCLLCGALGLLSVGLIHDKNLLLLSMTGVGIAWASTLAMPYAILAGSLPPGKTGVYMGIFNFFIVTPEIIASVGFGWVMLHVLHNSRLAAVIAGGVFMALAAVLMQRVVDRGAEVIAEETALPGDAEMIATLKPGRAK